MASSVSLLIEAWRAKAEQLERYAPVAAVAFRDAALELEAALHSTEDGVTLAEAERLGGYSADHLSRLVREGRLTNVGRKYAPRIRRADVPVKPGHALPLPPPADQFSTRRRIVADAQAQRGA
jgi:hypothetical protein